MNKKGIEWLNIAIVVMSVVIVLFSAVALTVIYDTYNPDDKSSSNDGSVEIPGINTTSSGTSSGTGTNTNRGTSGTSGSSGGSGTSGTTTTSITSANSASCTNDCSPLGAKKCSGNYALYCGDFDGDGCYEWGSSVSCVAGCLNGLCNAGLSLNSEISRCYETNPSHNPLISGNITDKYGSIGFDSCYNSTTLRQYRCASDNSSSYSLVYCQNGCNAGACLSISQVAINNNANNVVINCTSSSDCNLPTSNTVSKYCNGVQLCTQGPGNTCVNPGTTNSYCINYVTSCSACSNGQTCSNGACVASNSVSAPVVDCDQSWATLDAEGNNLNYCSVDGDCRVRNNFNSNCFPIYYNKDADLTAYNQLIASYPSSCSQAASGCSASLPQYGLSLKCVSGKCQNVINQCKVISDCIPNYCSQSAGCTCTSGVCTQGPYCGNGVCDSGETGDSCESGPVGCAPAGMYTGDTSCLLIKPVSCTYTLKKGSCGVDCGAISSCSGQGSYSLTRCTCYNGKLACVY